MTPVRGTIPYQIKSLTFVGRNKFVISYLTEYAEPLLTVTYVVLIKENSHENNFAYI
jgi:hypothetical protein